MPEPSIFPLRILLVNYHSVTRLFGSFHFTHGDLDGSVLVLMRLDGRVEHLPDVGRHRRHGSKGCKVGIALIDFPQDRDDPAGAFQLLESLARGLRDGARAGVDIYVRRAHKTAHVLNKLPKGISATRQAAPTGHLDSRDQRGGEEGVRILGLPKSDPDRSGMQTLPLEFYREALWRRSR